MNDLIFKQSIHNKIQSKEYDFEELLFLIEVRNKYNFDNSDLVGFFHHMYTVKNQNKKLKIFKEDIKKELIMEENLSFYDLLNKLLSKKDLNKEERVFFSNIREEFLINTDIKKVFKQDNSELELHKNFMNGSFDIRHIKQIEEYKDYYETEAIKIQYYILEAFKYIYALSYQDGFLNKLERNELGNLNKLYELSLDRTNSFYAMQQKPASLIYPDLSFEFIENDLNHIRTSTSLLTNRFIKTHAIYVDNELKEEYGTLPKNKILTPYKLMESN